MKKMYLEIRHKNKVNLYIFLNIPSFLLFQTQLYINLYCFAYIPK